MLALGWGDPDAPNFYADHIVTINPIKGVTLHVHRVAAPIFIELTRGLQRLGAKLPQRADDWSFANRDIRGYPGQKSFHAWGLAIDLDATENPMGSARTSFPVAKTRELVDGLRFVEWGFEWDSRPDPMHFEIHGQKSIVKAYGTRLLKR
jgi:hypothetical protein